MNRFEYIKAPSVQDAIEMMNSTVPEATLKSGSAHIVKAAGTDLLDLIKEGVVEPGRVIDLNKIPGLKNITFSAQKGGQIGPMVTLAEVAASEELQRFYPALATAAAHAATPQIRNMATMGGNLMQRPRCWYFRSNLHKCRKKGGTTCFAQIGQNQFHGIFNTNICPCVHPSSLATALVAYGGEVELTSADGKRVVLLEEFFTASEVDVTCENVATNKEIITNIMLPFSAQDVKAAYIKQGQRESYDWSMGDVAVVMEMDGLKCRKARIVFGAASSIPLRRRDAEKALEGKTITDKVIRKTAEAALIGATPLTQNQYKVPLFKTLVERAINQAIA